MTPSNMVDNRRAQALGYWCEVTRQWLSEEEPDHAYAQLLFAFGLSRLGEPTSAHRLTQQAQTTLTATACPVHLFLCEAIRSRIDQSTHGLPHTGPLAPGLRRHLEQFEPGDQDSIDAFRCASRILEPEGRGDSRRLGATDSPEIDTAIRDLFEVGSPEQLQEAVEDLHHLCMGQSTRLHLLRLNVAAMALIPRLPEEAAWSRLSIAVEQITALPKPKTVRGYRLCATLLEHILQGASYLQADDELVPLLDYFHGMVDQPGGMQEDRALADMATTCLRSLWEMGKYSEAEQCHCRLMEWLHQQDPSSAPSRLHLVLSLAEAWLMVGKEGQAYPVLDEVRDQLLYRPSLDLSEDDDAWYSLAKRYLTALRPAPLDEMSERIEEIFQQIDSPLGGPFDNLYYALPAVELVEAMVCNVINLGPPHCYTVEAPVE